MKKKKLKKIITYLLLITLLFELFYSIYNICLWKIDNDNIKKEISNINSNVDIVDTKDSSTTEIIGETDNIPLPDPYWDYIKMSLIDVNFNKLKKINSDVKGWIMVGGTNINYPFVQAKDNNFYLNHSFNKNKNQAGWLFLDYRNNMESDRNIIIYGHALKSGAIFGSLKNILESSWFQDTNNYIVKISTEYENSLWEIFSIYHIPVTSDYLKINFTNDEIYLEFLNTLKNRSVYDFNTTINSSDKILTLSTCYNNDSERVVLHAKLIKREVKY